MENESYLPSHPALLEGGANNFHISSFKFEQFNLKRYINLILKNNWIFHWQIKFSLKYKFFTSCHLLFLSFVMDQLTYDNLLLFFKIFLDFSWFPFMNQSKTVSLFSLDHCFLDFTPWCGARSCGNINSLTPKFILNVGEKEMI